MKTTQEVITELQGVWALLFTDVPPPPERTWALWVTEHGEVVVRRTIAKLATRYQKAAHKQTAADLYRFAAALMGKISLAAPSPPAPVAAPVAAPYKKPERAKTMTAEDIKTELSQLAKDIPTAYSLKMGERYVDLVHLLLLDYPADFISYFGLTPSEPTPTRLLAERMLTELGPDATFGQMVMAVERDAERMKAA